MRQDIPQLANQFYGVPEESQERKLLLAAYDALRSYQYGNSSTELAEMIADAIGMYFSNGRQ